MMASHAQFDMVHASGMHAIISQAPTFHDLLWDVSMFCHRYFRVTIGLMAARISFLGFHQYCPFSIALATMFPIDFGIVDQFLDFEGLGSVGLSALWFWVAICSA